MSIYRVAALVMVCLAGGLVPVADADLAMGRFFHGGDGVLILQSRKNGAVYSGRYRSADGHYLQSAYNDICRVFGAPCEPGRRLISLRLVEFIDYLQDRFDPEAKITITSGYRSPQYNRSIRTKGALAAKASLHQYGMAADLILQGVESHKIWSYVKALGFGGAGYYHGETVHVDVGPARWWDETSTGVGSGLADDNKLIRLVSDFDIYPPGAEMTLRMVRMTAFPIGVRRDFQLVRLNASGPDTMVYRFVPSFSVSIRDDCPQFNTIEQMDDIRWRLPLSLAPGDYQIRARFCGTKYSGMPTQVSTALFRIRPSE